MKLFLVDTITTVLFFTCLAAMAELFVVGLAPRQVLFARLVMVPVMVLTARPYGLWRDLLLRRLRPRRRIGVIATDTLAFLGFQVPVYVLTLIVAGADAGKIAVAAGTAAFFMLFLGAPFGLVLDRVRRLAGVAPPPRPDQSGPHSAA